YPAWTSISLFTALFFAVGVGLPGGSIVAAGDRLVFSLLGGLWGLVGVGLHRFVIASKNAASGKRLGVQSTANPTESGSVEAPHPHASWKRCDTFIHALIVGIASAFGLAIAVI